MPSGHILPFLVEPTRNVVGMKSSTVKSFVVNKLKWYPRSRDGLALEFPIVVEITTFETCNLQLVMAHVSLNVVIVQTVARFHVGELDVVPVHHSIPVSHGVVLFEDAHPVTENPDLILCISTTTNLLLF